MFVHTVVDSREFLGEFKDSLVESFRLSNIFGEYIEELPYNSSPSDKRVAASRGYEVLMLGHDLKSLPIEDFEEIMRSDDVYQRMKSYKTDPVVLAAYQHFHTTFMCN